MARKSYNVNLNASNWDHLFSTGTGNHPDSVTGGWEYDFSGEPHYLMIGFAKPLTIKHTLTVEGTLTVSNDTWDTSPSGGGTAYATVMLRKQKDGALTDGDGRFWCNNTRLNLETVSGAFTLSIPLDPDNFSNVDGQKHSKAFKRLIGTNLGSVGFTFGSYFYGHGVVLSGGTAVLKITKFKFS